MYQTNYVKAASTEDAVGHLAKGGQLLAGGMTLIPTMKQRLAAPKPWWIWPDAALRASRMPAIPSASAR